MTAKTQLEAKFWNRNPAVVLQTLFRVTRPTYNTTSFKSHLSHSPLKNYEIPQLPTIRYQLIQVYLSIFFNHCCHITYDWVPNEGICSLLYLVGKLHHVSKKQKKTTSVWSWTRGPPTNNLYFFIRRPHTTLLHYYFLHETPDIIIIIITPPLITKSSKGVYEQHSSLVLPL